MGVLDIFSNGCDFEDIPVEYRITWPTESVSLEVFVVLVVDIRILRRYDHS